MKEVKFAEFKRNVVYESREAFLEAYYTPESADTQINPKHKGMVTLILTDGFGVPYYFEVSKLLNKFTGGKLNSKIYKPDVMLDKIGEALAKREFILDDDGKIEDFSIQLKKAIKETGY